MNELKLKLSVGLEEKRSCDRLDRKRGAALLCNFCIEDEESGQSDEGISMEEQLLRRLRDMDSLLGHFREMPDDKLECFLSCLIFTLADPGTSCLTIRVSRLMEVARAAAFSSREAQATGKDI